MDSTPSTSRLSLVPAFSGVSPLSGMLPHPAPAAPLVREARSILEILTAVTDPSSKATAQTLKFLRHSNPVEFDNALVELAATTGLEVAAEALVSTASAVTAEPSSAATGTGTGIGSTADAKPIDAPVTPQAKKLSNEEKANMIAKLVSSEVEDITPAVLQWTTYRAEAKKSLAGEFNTTEANRAKETALFNKLGEMQGVSIFSGLIRTAYSITKIITNIFIGLARLLVSSPLNCCGSVATKTEQRERAIQKWTHIKEDVLNALCGLGQAVPFFGAHVMSVLAEQEFRTAMLSKADTQNNKIELVVPKTEEEKALANNAALVIQRALRTNILRNIFA